MTKMKINEAARTIEMTKMFYRAACQFGTEEYKMLQEARRDYPGFTTSIAQPKKNSKAPNEAYKGLDYKYMEKYIIQEHMKVLLHLRVAVLVFKNHFLRARRFQFADLPVDVLLILAGRAARIAINRHCIVLLSMKRPLAANRFIYRFPLRF